MCLCTILKGPVSWQTHTFISHTIQQKKSLYSCHFLIFFFLSLIHILLHSLLPSLIHTLPSFTPSFTHSHSSFIHSFLISTPGGRSSSLSSFFLLLFLCRELLRSRDSGSDSSLSLWDFLLGEGES